MKKNLFSAAIAKFKSQYIPTKDENLRLTTDGNIAAPHGDGYTTFINDELVSIPEELTVAVPMFLIDKPVNQVQVGDIIKTTTIKSTGKKSWTYHKVCKITDGKITTSTFGGNTKNIKPIKEYFSGLKTVSVVFNPFQGQNDSGCPFGGMNPMMFAMLGDSFDTKKLMPLMMTSQFQSGTQQGFNPMMLAMLSKDGDDDSALSAMVMMQMFNQNGGNGFASLFGTPVTTPVESAQVDGQPADADNQD